MARTCDTTWSLLAVALLVLLSACVFVLFRRQAWEGFPKDAPLFLNETGTGVAQKAPTKKTTL